ncbi:MAG: glycosyltransferase [Candidatus Buchananbacteria bacterium]|nr:glycosyltransferase [Candidatus Buchananbacteria bacterium]
MKILQINKFFYPKGGTETYLLSLISLLKKNGQEVMGFSQRNKNNINIKGREFFMNEIKLEKFYFKNIFKIGRIFWSFSAKRNIKKLINQEKIDLVHIHNIYHQISPSILPVLHAAGLPIVMTVHDFKLVNPNYTLWVTKNHKSSKSFLAQALMLLEYSFHKSIKIYQRNIDLFIAPSDFVKNQLVKAGFKANKIIVLPHFVEVDEEIKTNEEKNYFVCFGRLDESKGVDGLIKAFSQISTDAKLKIIGSGPKEKELKQLAHDLKMENKIEFIPYCHKQELASIIAQSLFAVFPSLVCETFGLGVVESYFLGKPVIASRVGAYEENVIENKTGLLFEPSDISQLKEALEKLILNPDLRKSMGQFAQKMAEEKFTAKCHLRQIIKIYNALIEKSGAEKKHYELEKEYALKILATPPGPARNKIIAQAYDEINSLVNDYRAGGIRGHNNSTFKITKNLVSKNDAILDYGCGGGELVSLLNSSGYNAYGYDVSEAMINQAKAKQKLAARFMSGDLNQIQDKYDLIVMDNVIEHIAPDEMKATLLKLKNILTDKGRLLVITPHRFSGPHDISGHFLKLGSRAQGLHLKEFNLRELVRQMKESGYSKVSGYLFNPRIMEKFKIAAQPRMLWLKRSLLLEKMFDFKIFKSVLKLNRKLTKALIAVMFPTIIIAQK